MDKKQIQQAIETTIQQIEGEYQISQGMILTEDDLMSIIFTKLSTNYPELVKPQQTEDLNIFAPMLHTELSWYDKHGKLTIKPDITILDPKYLSILTGGDGVKLPSKQYSFRGNAILLELKFVRSKKGILKKDLQTPPHNTIKGDIEKIKRLYKRLEDQGAPYDLFCYFIVFNKTNQKCEEFSQLSQSINDEAEGKYKMIYATGNVQY